MQVDRNIKFFSFCPERIVVWLVVELHGLEIVIDILEVVDDGAEKAVLLHASLQLLSGLHLFHVTYYKRLLPARKES